MTPIASPSASPTTSTPLASSLPCFGLLAPPPTSPSLHAHSDHLSLRGVRESPGKGFRVHCEPKAWGKFLPLLLQRVVPGQAGWAPAVGPRLTPRDAGTRAPTLPPPGQTLLGKASGRPLAKGFLSCHSCLKWPWHFLSCHYHGSGPGLAGHRDPGNHRCFMTWALYSQTNLLCCLSGRQRVPCQAPAGHGLGMQPH